MRTTIPAVIGSNKIKYDKLNELFGEVDMSRFPEINLFIDGNVLFSKLYRAAFTGAIDNDEEFYSVIDIVVGVLNVIGHYRRYFATRLKRANKICLVYSTKSPTFQCKVCPDYKRHIWEKYQNSTSPNTGWLGKVINEAMDFARELLSTAKDAFIINTENIDTSSIIGGFIPSSKTSLSILMTGMDHTWQLLADNIIQIICNRDNSRLVMMDNLKANLIKSDHPISVISPMQLPLIRAFSGSSDVDIDPIKKGLGIRKVLTAVHELNDSGEKLTIGRMCDKLSLIDDIDTVKNRFIALSIPISMQNIDDSVIAAMTIQMMGFYDNGNTIAGVNRNLADISSICKDRNDYDFISWNALQMNMPE